MIPTYNCARLLRKTLESVLAQDPGPDLMQIEVIDDRSTNDDPELVVQEMGRGRVAFFRKPKNQGAVANFNTCIERSRGHLVHILHGDDFVAPEFYRNVERVSDARPEASLIVVRSIVVDEAGEIEYMGSRLAPDDQVRYDIPDQHYRNHIFTPGIVARRSAYEAFGGFMPELVHVADWELTRRFTQLGGCAFINLPLAYYRLFPQNDTGKLARTGENLRDWLRLGDILAARDPGFQMRLWEASVREHAIFQYHQFTRLGDDAAAEANFAIWLEVYRKTATWYNILKLSARMKLRSAWRTLETYLEGHLPSILPFLRAFKENLSKRVLKVKLS